MIVFDADSFFVALKDLLQLEESIGNLYQQHGGTKTLSSTEAGRARFIINSFFVECGRAELSRPLERQERLTTFGEPSKDQSDYTLEKIKWELMELRVAAFTDLRNRKFLRLEETYEPYYYNQNLFGDRVAECFPKATYDIIEAGNCQACGRYTACIFHLMRVTEHGLRALAKRLRVPFPRTFELKTWDELIRNIESEIQKIIQQPRTPRRNQNLEFYNTAAAQFRYFKDGWRNHVMHTRTT